MPHPFSRDSDSAAALARDAAAAVAIRPLASIEDYAACVRLQDLTWGAQFSERVPIAILKVAQRIGGVAAGAFDDGGGLLGFVFGMTGIERGELVHWSDMLAVIPEMHNQGLGRRLKEYQRERCLDLGVQRIYWTFDPLVARNAHFNFNRLGAYATEYVESMYGPDTSSTLHRGVGTDRFIVAWPIAEPAPAYLLGERTGHAAGGAPVLTPETMGSLTNGAPIIRIEIPADISAVQEQAVDEAAAWRQRTRGLFLAAERAGYRVAGFYREADGRCFYALVHSSLQPN